MDKRGNRIKSFGEPPITADIRLRLAPSPKFGKAKLEPRFKVVKKWIRE